jgi:hypothetical protein
MIQPEGYTNRPVCKIRLRNSKSEIKTTCHLPSTRAKFCCSTHYLEFRVINYLPLACKWSRNLLHQRRLPTQKLSDYKVKMHQLISCYRVHFRILKHAM